MPDLTNQLANYFDAIVERITAEDVLERRTGLHPSPVHRRPLRARPVVVFVAAALAVIVLIGGMGWFIGRESALESGADVVGPGLVLILQPTLEDHADFGTISISIEGWEGAEGYQLLAGVWRNETELVGGALWTKVDSDPFYAEDVVHPPVSPYENTRNLAPESWGLEDYLWDETARLAPGAYRVTLWSNPDVLHPYGSHLPALPYRTCEVDVEVVDGEESTVVISGSSVSNGPGWACPAMEQTTEEE